MAARRSVGQFDATLLSVAQRSAQEAVSAFRTTLNVAKGFEYPRVISRSAGRGYTDVCIESVTEFQMSHLHQLVQGAVNAAITTAALQQNRSTMTKPIPESLGEIELELASIENRMRKRMTTNRQLDERTRLLRAAATKLRYPQEPNVSTIRFEKQFTPGGKVYIYAAQRTPAGRWFATGQGHPGAGRSWRVLVDFIREDNVLAQPQRDLFEPLHGEALPF